MAMKIVGGMSTEEHHEFDIDQTPAIFEKQGFEVEQMQSFQLGLNRLFVFRKPWRRSAALDITRSKRHSRENRMDKRGALPVVDRTWA
jgi:hypothetical protein